MAQHRGDLFEVKSVDQEYYAERLRNFLPRGSSTSTRTSGSTGSCPSKSPKTFGR